MIRVAAYARVSTDSDGQLSSVNNQIKYFSEYIKNHDDWSFAGVYSDTASSGTQTKKRIGFNNMIAACKKGEIDLILTKEVSRFARNTVDTLEYTRFLRSLGVGVIFINDNIDTRSDDGEFRLSIMASVAQEESRKTSERVKWGQRRAMENGVVFGNSLFGFEIKNGKMEINKAEAEIVKKIYDMYAYGEKSAYAIAAKLNSDGIRPPRAEEWSGNTILKILKNEKYIGDLLQRKSVTEDYITHKRIKNSGRKIFIQGHHAPIIEKNTWEAAQKRLNENKKNNSSSNNLFEKKVICRTCGAILSYGHRTKKNGEYVFFRCKKCSKIINKKIITEIMKSIVSEEDINGIALNIEKNIIGMGDINAKIERLNKRRLNIIEAYASDKIDITEMTEFNKRYGNMILELQKNRQIFFETKDSLHTQIINSFFSDEVYSELVEKIIIGKPYAEVILYGGECYFFEYFTQGYKDNYSVTVKSVDFL